MRYENKVDKWIKTNIFTTKSDNESKSKTKWKWKTIQLIFIAMETVENNNGIHWNRNEHVILVKKLWLMHAFSFNYGAGWRTEKNKSENGNQNGWVCEWVGEWEQSSSYIVLVVYMQTHFILSRLNHHSHHHFRAKS